MLARKVSSAKKLLHEGGYSILLKHTLTKYVLRPLDSYLGVSAFAFLSENVVFLTNDFDNDVEVARLPLVSQDKDEFLHLVEEAKGAKEVLEIGTFRGGTSFLFYKLLGANVTTVDLKIPILTRLVLSYKSNGKIRLIQGDSHDEETLKKVSDRKYDLLFIDGDHSYEGVKKDFEMYSPLVRKGGLVAFHDILSEEGVNRFWNEIKRARYESQEIINNVRKKPLGIGVLKL
jgi:predicted O-methyltransferase YrrM